MAEFEAGGHRYQTVKMNVREQLKLLQNLGPLFPPLMRMLLLPGEDRRLALSEPMFIAPFFEVFAAMTEQEVDRIVNRCFAVTKRGIAANGHTMWGPPLWSGSRDQYDDIDLYSLFTIVWEVIMENLGGFLGTGTPAGPDPAPATTPTSQASAS
jgi:hypothetical protein